jgi:glutathione synthase/RimK-type ligase-like ATP-grasp enzyme
MIVIFTSKYDSHVESVAKHLSGSGASWIRLNTEDFATNVAVVIDPCAGSGTLKIKDSGKSIDLSAVSAVWYRKPESVDCKHFDLDDGAKEYVEAEFNEVLLGVYSLLNQAFWINDPFETRISHRKMLQLRVAARCGFQVPETIITNVADEAFRFSSKVGGDLAIKSLGALTVATAETDHTAQYGIFTRRITDLEIKKFGDKIEYLPTKFQRFVKKKSELRVVCVGGKVFACRIHTRADDLTNEDYRFDTLNLCHSPVDLPHLHKGLHAYLKEFNLNFGCFDFIEPEGGGDPIFLECNPNGQWRWVEEKTGQPIGSAIAELLLANNGHPGHIE